MVIVFVVFVIFWSAVGSFALPDGELTYVNPYMVHKYEEVNWLGAILISIAYTFICPIGAVCYWVYKLCTIGRKRD